MRHFLPKREFGSGWYWLGLAWAWLLALSSYAAPPPLRLVPRGQLVGGANFTLHLRADGTLYAWGDNQYGQLGDGTTTAHLTPTAVPLPAGVRLVQVSATAGATHTLALATDGRLYAWGFNGDGQLGDGTTTNRLAPTLVPLPAGVRLTQVVAGTTHSLALAADGTLYSWGLNAYGQLGDGTTTTRLTPTAATMPGGARFTQLALGLDYSLALAADGTAYGWGRNFSGQLGDGTLTDRRTPTAVVLPAGVRLTQLASGVLHTIALAADGSAYAWGDNNLTRLGDGTTAPSRSSPVPVALPAGVRLVQVAAGVAHSLALAADGTLYAWGDDSMGQLGDGLGAATSPPKAVALPGGSLAAQVVAGRHSGLALTAAGTLYAWGRNSAGQLGDGTTTQRNAPVAVPLPPTPAGYTQASGGYWHSVGLRADGIVWAWGRNNAGQLGNNSAIDRPLPGAVALPAGGRATQLAAGDYSTLVLAADGLACAWGDNTYGQLGDGSTTQRAAPVAVALPAGVRLTQVAAGFFHGLGLAADGTVYGWGDNQYGQLGDGTTTGRPAPVAVLLPAGVRVVQVAAGFGHSLALAADGTVYSWGWNNTGQLGTGDFVNRATPTVVALPAGAGGTQLVAGAYFSLALTAAGTAYAWGRNTSGQLGDGTTTQRNAPVAVAAPASGTWRQVAAGFSHGLGLSAEGGLYTWGENQYGQLGTNTTTTSATPLPAREFSALATWAALGLSPAANHSLALGPGGSIYSAGLNNFGQLGDGTLLNSPVFIRNQAPLPTLAATVAPVLGVRPYPNPTAGAVTLHVTAAQAGPAVLTLRDALGRPCLTRTAQLPAGPSQVVLPGAEALAPGLYLLHVQQGAQQASSHLVRE